jgi:hypothetical protein
MDTSEWIAKKRVKFDFDVIYCGIGGAVRDEENHIHNASCEYYEAGSWIDLPITSVYYNFYLPATTAQTIYAEAVFETTAINAPNGANDNAQTANRLRDTLMKAKHGAMKTAYVDVVGRIGNLVLSDTGDYRFSNLFKNPLNSTEWLIKNVVKKVDLSSKNFVLAETTDIRGLAAKSPTGQNTYGTSPWLAGKMLTFSLSPEKNNIETLKTEPLRAGYPLYMSIDTIGKDITKVAIVPYFYWYDTATKSATPIDVYMESNGAKAVNLFGKPWEKSHYPLAVRWESEYKRRNVTDTEYNKTKNISGVYPNGDYQSIGSAQILVLDERVRTFIGSGKTLGENQDIGNLGGNEFALSVKRWHFTLGLPSSAFYVDAGVVPNDENRRKFEAKEGGVLLTADIFAYGTDMTLVHNMPGGGKFTIDGKEYTLPGDYPSIVALIDGHKSSKDDSTISNTH